MFTQDILILPNACHFGRGLIRTAERLNKWGSGTVIITENPTAEPSHYSEGRVCETIMITGPINETCGYPELEEYEAKLTGLTQACYQEYKKHNPLALVDVDFGYELVKYSVGGWVKEHVDALPSGALGGKVNRRLSLLAYLNDGYEGGELVFTRQKVTVKPRAGDVVLFPSGFTHPHVGLPVKAGTKYVIVTWLGDKIPE